MVIYGHIWSLSPEIRNLLKEKKRKEKRRNASHLDLLAPQQVKRVLGTYTAVYSYYREGFVSFCPFSAFLLPWESEILGPNNLEMRWRIDCKKILGPGYAMPNLTCNFQQNTSTSIFGVAWFSQKSSLKKKGNQPRVLLGPDLVCIPTHSVFRNQL